MKGQSFELRCQLSNTCGVTTMTTRFGAAVTTAGPHSVASCRYRHIYVFDGA